MGLKLTLEELQDAIHDQNGFCIKCGAEHWNIEPDARNYRCEDCGENQVFGAEEILFMEIVE